MKKYILIVIGLMFVTSLLIVNNVKANPSKRAQPLSCSTQGTSASSLSTTSISYMTPGTATTTATCDTTKANLGTDTLDKAYLALQVTASSTGLTNFRFEYSEDGIDWYGDNLYEETGLSTTTASNIIWDSNYHTHSIQFASSTSACADNSISNNNRNCFLIPVPTPTRYVRAVFTVPIGSTNSGVWASFIGKAESIR